MGTDDVNGKHKKYLTFHKDTKNQLFWENTSGLQWEESATQRRLYTKIQLKQCVKQAKYLLKEQEEGVFPIYFSGSLQCAVCTVICETSGADLSLLLGQTC